MTSTTAPSASLRETGPSPTLRTGRAFWTQKLAANIARDRFVNRALRKQGWRVVRIWEHELSKNPDRCVAKLRRALG